ncbi:hypothetical protein BDZ97DRAFT_2078815 [Flammula alnicola]|nr:hypothetical protein BDZ97DRAFT_2078815 [Flammula alnicola]
MFSSSFLRSFVLPTPTTPARDVDDERDSFVDDLDEPPPLTPSTSFSVPPSPGSKSVEDVQDDTLLTRGSTSSKGSSSILPNQKGLPAPPFDEDGDPNTQQPDPSPPSPETEDAERTRRRARRRQPDAFSMLQPIFESSTSISSTASSSSSIFGLNASYAKRMEETGRLRRLQSQQNLSSRSEGPSTSVPDSPNVSEPPSSKTSHSKSQSESTLPPPYIPPTLDKSGEPLSARPIATNYQVQDQQKLLESLLSRTQRELETAKAEIRRTTAERFEEKESLLERLEATEAQNDHLNKEIAAQTRALHEANAELFKTRSKLNSLALEKHGWQAKLDTMHHKLQRAERQIRCLDHVTRAKLEVRQEGISSFIRRTKQALAKEPEPSVEVIGAVEVLNEEILQIANLFVENLERTNALVAVDVERARAVVGEGMSSMMETQTKERKPGFRLLLTQVVLEVFMAHWCSAIIEGWYPKQRSFADLLIELSAQSANASHKAITSQIMCGRPIQIVQPHSSTSMAAKFPDWVSDIIKDLGQLLRLGGLKVRNQRASMFSAKILSLVKLAYDLRAALAEKDLCGGLELAVVGPDTPFQAKWMDEAHTTTRTNTAALSQMEHIAGTSGLGLQRTVGEQSRGGSSDSKIDMILKPKVVLIRVLQESP